MSCCSPATQHAPPPGLHWPPGLRPSGLPAPEDPPADPTLSGLPPAPWTPPEVPVPLRKALLDPDPGAGPPCCPGASTPPGSDAPVTGLASFPAVSPPGWKPPKARPSVEPLSHPHCGVGVRGSLQTPLDNRHHEGTAVGEGLPAPAESLPAPDTEPPARRPWGLGASEARADGCPAHFSSPAPGPLNSSPAPNRVLPPLIRQCD